MWAHSWETTYTFSWAMANGWLYAAYDYRILWRSYAWFTAENYEFHIKIKCRRLISMYVFLEQNTRDLIFCPMTYLSHNLLYGWLNLVAGQFMLEMPFVLFDILVLALACWLSGLLLFLFHLHQLIQNLSLHQLTRWISQTLAKVCWLFSNCCVLRFFFLCNLICRRYEVSGSLFYFEQ